ncbi:MAG: ABC transporter ATP-binding protein [Gemmataceae bacterium]|nr:ABC transporter ATP-binding protein [Gemmataceae bacterium]
MTAIDIKGLDFTYSDGKRALHELRFQVGRGETVGLVGPNGAGKTTLFLCLAGVLHGPAGALQVAGLDPCQPAERRQLPARVGIIFQNSDDQLFSTTVGDDVAFGPLNLGLPRDEVRRRVGEALAHVGLAGFEERVPFHLSGGEKRRAAIAGVLAMQPEILLLDEPSMFLDPRGRRELIHFLNQQAVTKIIASHDLDMVLDTCKRVVVLDQGRLVADGVAEQVLADHALMEAHGLEVPYRLRK